MIKVACVFSRSQKKTSKAWSELCGPRAQHSEGKPWKPPFSKSSCSKVNHVQQVPRAHRRTTADRLWKEGIQPPGGGGEQRHVAPPSFLGTRGPALPALVAVAVVYQTEFISFSSLRLLCPNAPTPLPRAPYCISYTIPLTEGRRMYSQTRKRSIYLKLSTVPFGFSVPRCVNA